jgi:hypothetical protein
VAICSNCEHDIFNNKLENENLKRDLYEKIIQEDQGSVFLKNYAFIDGNNLFYGVKSLGFVMDFAKFHWYD